MLNEKISVRSDSIEPVCEPIARGLLPRASVFE